jgi:hypothetical protein
MSQDYYSVLRRALAGVSAGQAEARWKVYELARKTLRRELYREYIDRNTGEIDWTGLATQMSAFNGAVQQIESEFAHDTPRLLPFSTGQQDSPETSEHAASSAAAVAETMDNAQTIDSSLLSEERDDDVPPRAIVGEILPPDSHEGRTKLWNDPLPPLSEFAQLHQSFVGTNARRTPELSGVRLWATVLAPAAVVFLGAVLYLAITHDGQLRAVTPQNTVVANAAPAAVKASLNEPGAVNQTAGIPLPTSYGVFAIDHGKLTNLQTLPIKVPDPRVGVSAIISAPSANTFDTGRLAFIIFRRDLIASAPAGATVRVIARVRQALVSDARGNEKSVAIEGSWAIRSNAYEMTVAPVKDNPAMIVIRPETSNFSFPPGRYALVLKNVGYDFAVAGPITDLVQCLERDGTVEMPIYLECQR